ncbi:MAG: hypothetical protein ABFD94_14710 [Armatimonadia bacterium]
MRAPSHVVGILMFLLLSSMLAAQNSPLPVETPAAGRTGAAGGLSLDEAATDLAAQLAPQGPGRKAEVLKVDATTTPTEIVVALGSVDGAALGQVLQIMGRGEALTDEAGNIIDFEWLPVGTAKISEVMSERVSRAQIVDCLPGKQPEKGNRVAVRGIPTTLAVAAFAVNDENLQPLGPDFADKLAAALTETGSLRVVPRKSRDCQGVISGRILPQGDELLIAAQVTDLQSGLVVASAETRAEKVELAPRFVGLFDTYTPLENEIAGSTLGSCPIGGRLYDNCQGWERWGGHTIFDLKGQTWSGLVAIVGNHDTQSQYSGAKLKITCDGKTALNYDFNKDRHKAPVTVRIFLQGVRSLRIDMEDGGLCIPGGFILVRDEKDMPKLSSSGVGTGGGDAGAELLKKLLEKLLKKK